MSIERTASLKLSAENGAELHALLDFAADGFRVGITKEDVELDKPGQGMWYFDEAACREAVEFFTRLADDLKDRRA